MSVAYELKQKRAALTDRLQQLERERVDIQELMRALDRVILSYEPDYHASALTRPEQDNRSRKGKTTSSQVKAAMKGVNKRQTVLELLREAGNPISVTDCAARFAAKIGIASEPANLSDIAHRLSAVLTQLTTAGRIRQSGQFDGRKVLWEVAA
jgi:hypothetical protein